MQTASQALERHGGCGYIEDWPLARLFRDAQVLPIGEGTTFILALDTLRSLRKENCQEAFFDFVAQKNKDLSVAQACAELRKALPAMLERPDQAAILPWCLQATRVMQATLLQQSAGDTRGRQVADYYLLRHFARDCQNLSPEYLSYACQHHLTLLANPF